MATIKIFKKINRYKDIILFFALILIICILKLNGQSDINQTKYQHSNKMQDSSNQDRVKTENKNRLNDTMRQGKSYPRIIKDTNSKH
jgi:hypothetical protein